MYLCVLRRNLQCQRQTIGIKAVVKSNQGSMDTRFHQVVGKVLEINTLCEQITNKNEKRLLWHHTVQCPGHRQEIGHLKNG